MILGLSFPRYPELEISTAAISVATKIIAAEVFIFFNGKVIQVFFP